MPGWRIDDRVRVARRFDPAAAAARLQVAVAERASSADAETDVVIGRHNPELIMPWELMNNLPAAYSDDAATRAKYRSKWSDGTRHLGDDFWMRLHAVAGAFIDADNRRVALERDRQLATGAARDDLDRRIREVNRSLCGLRADALAAARSTFGPESFDAFLYEVIAPGEVIRQTRSASPRSAAELFLWVEGGCR
jgi:hypothetical protein